VRRFLALTTLGLALVAGAATALAGGSLTDYRLLVLGDHLTKWGSPKLGTGGLATYALADHAMSFPGARNCDGIAPLGPMLAANRIAPAVFAAELNAALAAWSAVADIVFIPGDPATADILIGAESEPRGRAFTNVRLAGKAADGAPDEIAGSVVCLNPEMPWKVGFDGNLDVYDLRYTLTHEIGHAIGLDHPASRADLMNFRYTEAFRAPQPGDIAGAVALYGPASGRAPPIARLAPPAGAAPTANGSRALR
jgi:hypothetical protein